MKKTTSRRQLDYRYKIAATKTRKKINDQIISRLISLSRRSDLYFLDMRFLADFLYDLKIAYTIIRYKSKYTKI